MKKEIKEIIHLIGADIPDNIKDTIIDGVKPIEAAGKSHITFLSGKKYLKYLENTEAAAVITSKEFTVPDKVIPLYVDDPYSSFIKVLHLFNERSTSDIAEGIHETAFVDESAEIGENVSIGPKASISAGVSVGDGTVIGSGTVILKNSRVGKNCIFYPNVTIMDNSKIGDEVILHSGVVIGADGFGFIPGKAGLDKIPQTGSVVIEDKVEIGANSCVDRAVMGTTKIGKGTKIDNLVQVGHNVQVGTNTIIVSMAGISGSTNIGNNVVIGGQAGFGQHVNVGDGAKVAGQAGVTKDVPAGTIVSGYPAKDHMKAIKEEIHIRNLPTMAKKIKEQAKKIEELEKKLNS
ncbi:MAG: UDP-3-O-(3-hydroxymyristoyl)glucosamine N-acyltransferase [Acidobacteriota bacterium]